MKHQQKNGTETLIQPLPSPLEGRESLNRKIAPLSSPTQNHNTTPRVCYSRLEEMRVSALEMRV